MTNAVKRPELLRYKPHFIEDISPEDQHPELERLWRRSKRKKPPHGAGRRGGESIDGHACICGSLGALLNKELALANDPLSQFAG